MITGDCPYSDCDEALFIPLEDGRPIQKHACAGCNRVIWTLHSRIEPQSWTDGAFREEFDIDEETKVIKPRLTPPRAGKELEPDA
jgi:hypothetical protein